MLSARAQKNLRAAAARNSDWLPFVRISQTGDLHLTHARRNRRGQATATAQVLLADGWIWHGGPDERYFSAPLSIKMVKSAQRVHALLDRDIIAWRRDQALPVQNTRGRAKLFKC